MAGHWHSGGDGGRGPYWGVLRLRSIMEDLDELVEAFLQAFDNRDGTARLRQVTDLFGDGAVVFRVEGAQIDSMTVEAFVAPRQELLASGRVVGFHEWEVAGRTFRFGSLAVRVSRYAKRWTEGGTAQSGQGWKLLLLHRAAQGWRIMALAWSDEADGLPMDSAQWSERGTVDSGDREPGYGSVP